MSEPPIFWSWEGVVAICTLLVVVGRLIDSLIRRRRKEKMLATLAELEHKIALIPFRTYQEWMVLAFLRFFEKLSTPATVQAVREYQPDMMLPISWSTGVPGMAASVYATIFRILWTGASIIAILIAIFGGDDGWVFDCLAVYAASYLLLVTVPVFIAAHTLNALVKAFPKVEKIANEQVPGPEASQPIVFVWYRMVTAFNIANPENFCHFVSLLSPGARRLMIAGAAANHPLLLSLSIISRAILLSVLATIGAVALGISIADTDVAYDWFETAGATLRVTWPALLTLLNGLCDLATIFISVRLLGWFLSRGKSITLVAGIDILASAALSVILLSGLTVLARFSSLGVVGSLVESIQFVGALATFDASSSDPSWPLIPIGLTTALPVLTYLVIPLAVGLVVKPLAAVASYLSGWAGEQSRSPFFGLSAALASVLAVAKVFSEWAWFMEWIQR